MYSVFNVSQVKWKRDVATQNKNKLVSIVTMFVIAKLWMIYHIARKFGGELSLAVWWF